MKLELKHLVPYLPYGLIGRYKVGNVLPHLSEQQNVERNKILAIDSIVFFYKYCKPLLRPLSDLTNPITHNGETFVPIDELIKGESTRYEQLLIANQCITPELLPYYKFNLLVEWHFDVFGLLENGLAIDINTVSK